MGIMNLLKADWVGKVGQTVGAKWKNKSTIRSYTKPAYSDTPAQQDVRAGFGEMSKFLSLFTDQIKTLSSLNTKGMSVRNAIIKLNKAQITTGSFDPTALIVSRGGLLPVSGLTVNAPAGLVSLTASWTPSTSVTISAKARLVVIAVDPTTNFAVVGSALQSTGALSISAELPASKPLDVYSYLIDYRGSMKVGSVSAYTTVTTPAS